MSGRDIGNIVEIIKTDVKSAFSNPIVLIVLIGIIIIPSLYALINIQACWNPYENTGDVQFAIANLDNGTDFEGKQLNIGNELVKSLKNNTKFDWTFVTEDELRDGVYKGDYYAGIIIPKNLSENVVSIMSDDPKQAELEYVVNVKANPVAAKLTDTAANSVYTSLNAKIVEVIDIAAYQKLGELQAGLASGASQLYSGGTQLQAGSAQVSSGASQVQGGMASIQNGTATINEKSNDLQEGAAYLEESSEELQSVADPSLIPEGPVQDYMEGNVKLANGSGQLANYSAQLAQGSSRLAEGSLDLAEGSVSLAAGAQLLSMWVGALITSAMLKTGISKGTKYSPLEMYFGKLGLFVALSILQALVTLAGAYILGIYVVNPLLFVFSCLLVSVIFMILIYSLVSALGNVGKAIAILLLVVQISGTGGIYPVEIMDKVFQVLHPYLPMTYAITLVREAQLGVVWSNYMPALVILLAIGIVTIIVAIIIKEKADKTAHYFEECLENSGLF